MRELDKHIRVEYLPYGDMVREFIFTIHHHILRRVHDRIESPTLIIRDTIEEKVKEMLDAQPR